MVSKFQCSCVVSVYPHRLLAFSQNVRPGEGSVPTGPTKGKLQSLMTSRAEHNDSLWHPLHTKEGDEISMFWGPCLQSSISTLSFSFLALFFCHAISSCVYDHNHPYLVSERLFLAENKAFPYLRRALAHPRRALAIL